jgi:cystathionine beta-lyase/cystathionine gamma-synthase
MHMGKEREMDIRTRCAQGVDEELEIGRPLAPPIVTSSTFGFENQASIDHYFESGEGYVYSRYGNPTVRETERLLAALEGAENAVCFGSGMAAITTTFLSLVKAGERVAAQRELYGGTIEFLETLSADMGVDVVWLDRADLDRLAPERLTGCRVLFLETPTNPSLRIVDLDRVSAVGRLAGAIVVVDGTFATPALQRPLSLGVDLVVHSATKYLGGHGDLIGGAVAGSAELVSSIARRRKMLGGTMDPFSAFLLHRGMRTLAVRMEAHCEGAAEIAKFLEDHSKVERVFYPGLASHPDRELAARQMSGFGGMVSFVVAGGAEAAADLHDRLSLFSKAGSLGGTESLVSIPARMSHRALDPATRAKAGVSDGMLRLSVGLEASRDLVADLTQAFG